jgi:hypothetical protein
MLNSLLTVLTLIMVGIFAASSIEIADERAKRRRVEKWVRDRWPPTY